MSQIINKTMVKWGFYGAGGLVVFGVLLIAAQEILRFDSPLHKPANGLWLGIASPVLWIWGTLGVRGAEDLRVVILMLASVLLYLASLGFLAGALLSRITDSLCHRSTDRLR
jgi:hypothetical protein